MTQLRKALIEHCAPTLAGIKTGNMFSVKNTASDYTDEIRCLNHMVTKKGLRLVPIRKTERNTLIYLYRPDQLECDLCQTEAADILAEKGYRPGTPECCLVQLVKHLASDKEFPHEIGLFLGYPPSDVRSFMNSSCEGVQCTGCWKAYSNAEEAKKTFEKYRKCTELYRKETDRGMSLEDLIVDIRGARHTKHAV